MAYIYLSTFHLVAECVVIAQGFEGVGSGF